MHLHNVHLFLARPVLSHPQLKYRTDFQRRRLFFFADSANVEKLWPIAVVPVGDICKNRTSSKTSIMDIAGGQAAMDGVGTDGSLLLSC